MAERKALQKYYPPDFWDVKIPRAKKPKDRQEKVRAMIPFTCQCVKCGDFIHKGRKFNARKEFSGQTYLTIKRWRFYIRCPSCSGEITFLTDPENSGYVCENGAVRNFETAHGTGHDSRKLLDEEQKKRLREGVEDDEDVMTQLEKHSEANKREIESMDLLEELREKQARNESLNIDDVISRIHQPEAAKTEQELEEETRRQAEQFEEQQRLMRIRRIEDEQEDSLATAQAGDKKRKSLFAGLKAQVEKSKSASTAGAVSSSSSSSSSSSASGAVVKKRKVETAPPAPAPSPANALASLAGYDSGSDSDSSDE